MLDEEFKEKVLIAKKAVENEEEPYKTEAFKVILSHLLSSKTNTSAGVGRRKPSTKHDSINATQMKIEISNDLEELASKCKISEEQLRETISTKKNLIEVVKRLEGDEKFKHKIYSLCILTTYRILAGVEWLPSSYLVKSLDLCGAGDLKHLYRSLTDTTLIVASGKRRGMEYKITGKGLDMTYNIIHNLAKGEKLNEN